MSATTWQEAVEEFANVRELVGVEWEHVCNDFYLDIYPDMSERFASRHGPSDLSIFPSAPTAGRLLDWLRRVCEERGWNFCGPGSRRAPGDGYVYEVTICVGPQGGPISDGIGCATGYDLAVLLATCEALRHAMAEEPAR